MPKKKITGKSKLLTDRLEKRNPVVFKTQKLLRPRMKNYRLSIPDIQSLHKIVADVNFISPYKKISEVSVIKALIKIGSGLDPKEILKAIKEI